MDPSEMYNAERIQKISEIMPRFNAHVQPGDNVLFGLQGDPCFPASFSHHRPSGVVQRVKSSGGSNENATIRVKMDNGQIKDIPFGSVNPEQVWEFSDLTFQKVLKRSIDANMPDDPLQYRGTAGDTAAIEQLRMEMQEMKDNMMAEREQSQNFNNALIATISEVATDVSSQCTDGFCHVFKTEYAKMMTKGETYPPAFYSDFSDSEGSSDGGDVQRVD